MITHSGVHIQKIGGAAGVPTPADIAVQSARICRFGGAIWAPLMPHLIFVGLLAYTRSGNIENFVWGILHDAHEVATSDVPRPFKCDCMRKEQAAIDERLLERYLPNHRDLVRAGLLDFDLIKQCDDDACDIEAVELGLPGFSAIEIAHTKDYRNRTAVHTDEREVDLFHMVRLMFGHHEIVKGQTSQSVEAFFLVLEAARFYDYVHIRHWITSFFGPSLTRGEVVDATVSGESDIPRLADPLRDPKLDWMRIRTK